MRRNWVSSESYVGRFILLDTAATDLRRCEGLPRLNIAPTVAHSPLLRLPFFTATSKSDLTALQAEAISRGVTDLAAAETVATATAPRTAAASSTLANLVDAMLWRKSLDSVILHKGVFPLLMPGKKGVQILRNANGAARAKLDGDIARFLKKMTDAGTLPDGYKEGLPEDSALYAQGLAEVREDVVRSLRFQVEEQMVKRRYHLHSLEQSEGSNNAANTRKKAARCSVIIADRLRELSTWEVYGTDRDPAWEPTEATIKAAAGGDFPWGDEIEGNGAGEALQRHFGVRYRFAKAQVDRAEEESKYLKMEVVRLFNGLDGRIAEVDGLVDYALQNVQMVAADSSPDTWEARVLTGRIKLIEVERERLCIIQEEALANLTCYLPMAQ